MEALFAAFVASCVLGLAWIDGRRIALRDAEIARLDTAREADADEAAATYQAALDLCEYLGGEIDRLRILSVRRQDEIEALRCGDLVAFADGELAPDRAAAFRVHLGSCEACQAGLRDLVELDAKIAQLAVPR